MKGLNVFFLFLVVAFVIQCDKSVETDKEEMVVKEKKKVIYQVFTRLFGNENTTNKPWGTREENGVGSSMILPTRL